MRARFPLTIFCSILATSRSSRAVALLFVNARNSVHHHPFRACLAPSLCSCLFPQPVSTPARLQLIIHYLSSSSDPCISPAPSASTPSFALLPHPASLNLASRSSMPCTPTTSTSSSPHCNHFTQLHFSDPTTTVLNANTKRNRARAASSSGLTPIRLGVTPKKLLHISFTELNREIMLFIGKPKGRSIMISNCATTNAIHTCHRAPQLVRSFHTHELQHKCCSRITTRCGEDGRNCEHLRPDLVAHLSPTSQDPRRRSPLGNVFPETPKASMQVSTPRLPVTVGNWLSTPAMLKMLTQWGGASGPWLPDCIPRDGCARRSREFALQKRQVSWSSSPHQTFNLVTTTPLQGLQKSVVCPTPAC